MVALALAFAGEPVALGWGCLRITPLALAAVEKVVRAQRAAFYDGLR